MALATRPKPNVSHKKRQAQHHRHSKHYLRPYWPYLPMLAVVAGGVIVNALWSAGHLPGVTSGSATLSSLETSGSLSRIQALSGSQATGALDVVILISSVAFAAFVFRHSRRLNRLLREGETFMYRYAWVDVATVLVFTVGFVLTRPVGLIR